MGKTIMCSLCRNGIIGGGLIDDMALLIQLKSSQ